MQKLDSKKLLNIIAISILLIVPFLKFFSMNLQVFGIISQYDFINPAIVLYVAVPFLFFIYFLNLLKSKRKLDVYDYIFYVLVLSLIICTVFSIDKNIALFGKPYRHEGLFTVLSYYLLFINYKVLGNNKDIKRLLKIIVILGILNSIYSLLQIYTDLGFIIRYKKVNMASGMCGNPNFFGSLITTVISIVTCKILIDKKLLDKKILLLILLFVALINSQSTGPFLAYIITFIFLTIFLNIKNTIDLKKTIIVILVLINTFLSVYLINKTDFNIGNKGNYKFEMSVNGIKETVKSGGNGRIEIWKNSLDIVKKHPLIGIGYDNFYLAYPNPKTTGRITMIVTNGEIISNREYNTIVDNAHNVYLHILVSNGIIGLVPYLFLCLLTFIKGLKSKNTIIFLILSGFVAYSVQAFGNINVVQITPIYYILIGLILSEQKNTSYIE